MRPGKFSEGGHSYMLSSGSRRINMQVSRVFRSSILFWESPSGQCTNCFSRLF